jgi:hypothetical protein
LVTLPASQLSFNDVTANTSTNQYSYFVSIVLPSCDFTKSNNIVRSNVKSLNDGGLGIHEYQSDFEIQVAPNPSNGIFTIYLSGDSQTEVLNFEIVNSMGQKIVDFDLDTFENKKVLDLSQQASGLYFLKDKQGKWLKQIIIQQ